MKVISFMVVTLDGYYEGQNKEFDWPNIDDEFEEFGISQLNDIGMLLFGRATYEGMASYWPTPEAYEESRATAEFMNDLPKLVGSTTLTGVSWSNTRLIEGGVFEEVSKLKRQPGKDLAIFGSPTLTVSLLERGLVDELRVMVQPILLGAGRSLFTGLPDRVPLRLLRTTTFSSGNVLLVYRPVNS